MEMYKVRDASGQMAEVARQTYLGLVGDKSTAPYVRKVRAGEMEMKDVPEELRETVASIAAAREAFSGAHPLPAAQVLAELLALPPGQLKKVLTEEVLTVLAKYGYTEE